MLRLISWNCAGAFRNKTALLETFDPDLTIIQECENPELSTSAFHKWAENFIWEGENKNKGIGIFARNNHRIQKLDWAGQYTITCIKTSNPKISWKTEELRQFIPFSIDEQFNVLAVWTKGSQNESFGYMGQFWKYLQINQNNLSKEKTLIIGDFNSNQIWDQKDRWWNHSDVVRELSELNIQSIYHHQFNERQGQESLPTFFLRKDPNKAYHIDYSFASTYIVQRSNISIGKFEDWIEYSDHMPIFLEIFYNGHSA